jgi:hypothetical protein
MKRIILFVFLIPFLGSAIGSETIKDSTQTDRQYKNTIRYNFTSSLFFGSDFKVIGYERVLRPYQSFSVNIGLATFPKITDVDLDSVQITKKSVGSGFSLAADYRFYLKHENQHQAPRGVYIGPYLYYSLLKRKNDVDLILPGGGTVAFEIHNKLSVVVTGFQLGYQFLFWRNRIALDLILFGPGVGFYSYKADLSSNITEGEAGDLILKIKENLLDRYPGSTLLATGKSSFSKNKGFKTSDFGYRMVFQVGYRF